MRTSINVSLPAALREWVEEQVGNGGYGTVSEYFRHLLREERHRQLRRRIDARLLEALESGRPGPADAKFWRARRQELRKRLAKPKRRG